MNRVHWFAVSNPEQKRYPEWRRSFGISGVDIVFIPAAMTRDDSEIHVMLCASGDGHPLQRTSTITSCPAAGSNESFRPEDGNRMQLHMLKIDCQI
ncbi:hypothetical protein [Pseudomonas paeninsulae]|jgi:hypothetical protein|uniref:hypothetical protein n=1 Tax=Pseudomonas paeninsulae TaxID=3110772 RepID=UPI002D787E0C|nr:hypothetical protein [Pseudomonas sp. IT1137]